MTCNTLSSEDLLILHSFDTLQKAKECVDSIVEEEGVKVGIIKFFATSALSWEEKLKHFIPPQDKPSQHTDGFALVIALFNETDQHYINDPSILEEITQFKPKTQQNIHWLCENFTAEKQAYKNFVFQPGARSFLQFFLGFKNSEKLTYVNSLKTVLSKISFSTSLLEGFDKEEFGELINQYVALKEKRALNNEINLPRELNAKVNKKILKL